MAQKSVLGLSFLHPFIVRKDDEGSGGTALASTGNEAIDAAELEAFSLRLNGELPVASTTDLQAQKPEEEAGRPVSIKIGDESLTSEQIQAEIESGRKARAELASAKDKLDIGETFYSMKPEDRQVMLEVAEQLSKGVNPLADDSRTLAVTEPDVPDGARIIPHRWDELSDAEQYIYGLLDAVRNEANAKIKELGTIVSGLQGYVGQMHTQSQEQTLVAGLQALGVNATLASVKEMRQRGIDPAVAMKDPGMLQLMRNAHAPKKAEVKPSVPEGPGPTDDKTFDADDPNLSMEDILNKLNQGMRPSNPADLKRLEQMGYKFQS